MSALRKILRRNRPMSIILEEQCKSEKQQVQRQSRTDAISPLSAKNSRISSSVVEGSRLPT